MSICRKRFYLILILSAVVIPSLWIAGKPDPLLPNNNLLNPAQAEIRLSWLIRNFQLHSDFSGAAYHLSAETARYNDNREELFLESPVLVLGTSGNTSLSQWLHTLAGDLAFFNPRQIQEEKPHFSPLYVESRHLQGSFVDSIHRRWSLEAIGGYCRPGRLSVISTSLYRQVRLTRIQLTIEKNGSVNRIRSVSAVWDGKSSEIHCRGKTEIRLADGSIWLADSLVWDLSTLSLFTPAPWILISPQGKRTYASPGLLPKAVNPFLDSN